MAGMIAENSNASGSFGARLTGCNLTVSCTRS